MKSGKEKRMKKIAPREAVIILEKSGIIITVAEAEEVLKFLRSMAKIVVTNYLQQNSGALIKSKL